MNLSLSLFPSVYLNIACGICLVTGAWNHKGATMMGYMKSLWQKVSGGASPDETTEGRVKHIFPDTLEGFGYHFNEKGELVDSSGGRFQFVVRPDDRDYNQQRYVALGELVTDYLYKVMEKELKLEKVYVPVDAKKSDAQSFIFRTKDAGKKKDLMVLIHGSGAVRAGQWSRKLIINENVDTGSQLPYIRRAIAEGFGVIVMNPNLNEEHTAYGKLEKVKGSETPEEHGVYVWQHFVKDAKAENIAVVAHSYGGIVAFKIAQDYVTDFRSRVFSVVFTDSVHTDRNLLWTNAVKDFMKERAVNFVSSKEPLSTKVKSQYVDDCLTLSAGTPEHERTSHSCITSAFQFILDNHQYWMSNKSVVPERFLRLSGQWKSEL